MAVTAVETMQLAATASAKMDEVTYEAPYRIKVNSALDGPGTIFSYLRANGPWLGDGFSYGADTDTSATLTEWSNPTREKGSDSVWIATARYSNKVGGGQKPDTSGSPTDWPLDWRPEMHISWAQHEVPCETAIYRGGFTHATPRFTLGNEYAPQNSALEIYDPPLVKDFSRATLRCRMFRELYNFGVASALLDLVNKNSATFQPYLNVLGGVAARTLKVSNVQGTPKRENREHPTYGYRVWLDYFELEIEIQYRRDGWRDNVVDRGLRKIVEPGAADGFGGTFSLVDLAAGNIAPNQAIKGPDQQPISGPVLLDGAGNPKQVTDRVPVTIQWQKYGEESYVANDYLGAFFTF
jgi:hypothetical protein